jgi:hypothetical protein
MKSESNLVNMTRQEDTLTANGMVTNSTSLNSNVDMFFLAGASRNISEKDIEILFQKAIIENPLVALKTLFWARDARGGAGERRFFRICSKFLNKNYFSHLEKNIKFIPEYGRWDDIFELDEKIVLPLIKEGLDNKNGLLAKWLPRQNDFASKVRKFMGLNPKEYRKLVVGLSNTVEQKMCAKEWDAITYPHVPSVAMNKYRSAFLKNDVNRFNEYISLVLEGKEEIKAGVLFPHQLYQAYKKGENKKAVEAQWMNLIDYMADSNERIIPVCDVSGSMTTGNGLPMDVSVSLGVYISERNQSIFKDAFITFSTKPKMQYLKGSLYEKLRQLETADWGGSTDLEAVYKLILTKATENKISESEMPTKILIISDMEFNSCTQNRSETALKMIQRMYYDAGYKLPELIFWNVNGRVGNVPADSSQKNVGLVSGFSPSILKSILQGSIESPEGLMLKTVMSDRYQSITV